MVKETRALNVPIEERDDYWSNLFLLIARFQGWVERRSDAAAFKSSSKPSCVAWTVDTGDGLRSAKPSDRPPEDGKFRTTAASLFSSHLTAVSPRRKVKRERKQPPYDEFLCRFGRWTRR